jgi:hypothetical protein
LPEVSGRRPSNGSPNARRSCGRFPYYHVVFSLPAAIGAIAFHNKAAVYDLLFRTAAETLTTIAADPNISARASASPLCCTPGARRSPTIRTSTSLFPAAASPRTDRAGSPANRASSSPCACSRACSAVKPYALADLHRGILRAL